MNRHSPEGFPIVSVRKSFAQSTKDFVSPDFSDKSTWYFASTDVADEVASTSDDITYSFAAGETVVDLDKVTDRAAWPSKDVVVKVNDIVVTSGFTVNLPANTVVFDVANAPSDVVKVSYSHENGSNFEIIADAGKKIYVDYVETQFSAGTIFNDALVFEMILNNTSTGNTDVVVSGVEYRYAKDFLNKGNNGTVMEPFGELTQKVNIFPWNYLSGFCIKPVGDDTTDPTLREFNKIRMYLKNDQPFTGCELATGTFYCYVENL